MVASLFSRPLSNRTSLSQDFSYGTQGGSNPFPVNISVPTTAMAKLGGSMGGVTLERSKLDLSQKVQTVEPKLSNDGGGGGIGKIIHNGGGGGGDDDDDPDEFAFGDEGPGDENFWRSTVSIFSHTHLCHLLYLQLDGTFLD